MHLYTWRRKWSIVSTAFIVVGCMQDERPGNVAWCVRRLRLMWKLVRCIMSEENHNGGLSARIGPYMKISIMLTVKVIKISMILYLGNYWSWTRCSLTGSASNLAIKYMMSFKSAFSQPEPGHLGNQLFLPIKPVWLKIMNRHSDDNQVRQFWDLLEKWGCDGLHVRVLYKKDTAIWRLRICLQVEPLPFVDASFIRVWKPDTKLLCIS